MKTFVIFLTLILLCSSAFAGYRYYGDLPGKVVTLRADEDYGKLYLGETRPKFNLMVGNLMAQARGDYLGVMMSGSCFEIYRPTLACVLKVDFYERTAKVRILGGTYKGETAWVLLNQIEDYTY